MLTTILLHAALADLGLLFIAGQFVLIYRPRGNPHDDWCFDAALRWWWWHVKPALCAARTVRNLRDWRPAPRRQGIDIEA